MAVDVPKRLTMRGRHTALPLEGDMVSQVCVGGLAALIFRDTAGGESELTFEEAITLVRFGTDLVLTGSRPGVTFDPRSLGPLVELVGLEVAEALALQDGTLYIRFANDWQLRVVPESGYEAWHYQYPRPGRPPSGDIRHHISVHGTDGKLL